MEWRPLALQGEMMEPSQFASSIARALVRFLRVYPLRQIALACALYFPFAIGLRFAFVTTGTERLVTDMIQDWGVNIVAAGLAFLTALAWNDQRARYQAKKRRAARADIRANNVQAAMERIQRHQESIRAVINGLDQGDKDYLKIYVDRRQSRLYEEDLPKQFRDHQIYARLSSLGIVDSTYHGNPLREPVRMLLLREPALVGSDRPPIVPAPLAP